MIERDITEQERRYMKEKQALPKSVLEKELEHVKERILDLEDDEEVKLERRFGRWLRTWFRTLELLKEKKQEDKKDVDIYV